MAIEQLDPEYKALAEAAALHEQHTDDGPHNPTAAAIAQATTPELPPPQQWPDKPMIIKSAMPATHLMTERVNTGPAMPISTDLFTGTAKLWVAGLTTTPPGIFEGHKRRTMLVVQGRFKSPLHFNDVLTGQYFPGPLMKIPAPILINTILAISRKLNPSMEIGSVKKPSMLAPVIATAQAINVAEPGSEPSLHAPPVEDMSLLGPSFEAAAGKPATGDQRKYTMAHNKAARDHRVAQTSGDGKCGTNGSSDHAPDALTSRVCSLSQPALAALAN
ncbi:hypothetical protein WJX73_010880 [Symbiochloris irregularis]|uniref:Domain of unknown function at the cortex 1 domain-containing protein n=1 Tax=Symbiochloris irregularis TaxID=706552 RepID=A0AAW1P379_9CHLO